MQHWSGFKELGSFGIVCRYVCIEHYPLERPIVLCGMDTGAHCHPTVLTLGLGLRETLS